MRAYHFLTAKDATDDIQKKRLKISRFLDMNDPFELIPVNHSNTKEKQIFLKTNSELDEKYGVICFSKSWRNPLLWSHYADKHRGVCLGFVIPDAMFTSIIYDVNRPVLDISSGFLNSEIDEKFMLRILSTKFKDWEYENEVRVSVLLDEQDPITRLYFKEFDESLILREVILGVRYNGNLKIIESIIKLCSPGIKLYQAALPYRSFNIARERCLY